MTVLSPSFRPRAALAIAAAVLCAAAWASANSLRPGVYDIVVETVMPHLEENLRYATVRERRCLGGYDPSAVFPMLQHRSLAGCKLDGASRQGGGMRYSLVCTNPHAATGTAHLVAGPDRIAGMLEITMGGKNMTFSQRIVAVRQGECERDGSVE